MSAARVKLTHVGNGVEIVGHSGARYIAAPGETVKFLAVDAAGLKDHPEWVAPSTIKDEDKTPILEGDDAE